MHLMVTSDVARRLGIGDDAVRKLDKHLQPIRLPNGHRRYAIEAVEALAQKRGR